MAVNFLEQLVAEWHEYNGYFVRRNVRVGRRPRGGHDCELDIVAFHPERRHLIHLEPSMDASSWEERERRYAKKFEAGRKHIPRLFAGMDLPTQIDQVAVLVFASTRTRSVLGGGRIMLVSELLAEIFRAIAGFTVATNAVPENFTILRSFQFVAGCRDSVWDAMSGKRQPQAASSGGLGGATERPSQQPGRVKRTDS